MHRAPHRLGLFSAVLLGFSAIAVTQSSRAEPGGTARTEEDRTRAREMMREGNELYGEGKLSEAYTKYLEAWRIAQAFDIACNLGGTASELSMNRDAAEYLDYCLRHYAASSRPEAVAAEQRARAAFERRANESRSGVGERDAGGRGRVRRTRRASDVHRSRRPCFSKRDRIASKLVWKDSRLRPST